MALIKCRECGKEISDKSRVCTHCGAQIKIDNENKKITTWLKQHIVVLIIIITVTMAALATIIIVPKVIYYKDTRLIMINGDSMAPTLKDGERKFYKKTDTLNRFDIVVFKEEYDGTLIKRIYGMPGETITIENENIYINGEKIEDKYAYGNTTDYETITLKDDEYFVLGDNRDNSRDSRIMGPVRKKNIIGVLLSAE